ncbi:MAG: hypothetical protein AAAB19_05980, partial [Rhizobium sp.]
FQSVFLSICLGGVALNAILRLRKCPDTQESDAGDIVRWCDWATPMWVSVSPSLSGFSTLRQACREVAPNLTGIKLQLIDKVLSG